MAIPFTCPVCEHRGNAPDDAMGRRVACPGCKVPFRLTGATTALPGAVNAPPAGEALPPDIALLTEIRDKLARIDRDVSATRTHAGCLLLMLVVLVLLSALFGLRFL